MLSIEKRLTRFLLGAALWPHLFIIAPPAEAAEKYAAGLAISSFTNALGEAEVGIWYPSTAAEAPLRLGTFDARAAKDGAPAPGRFPVALLSHGNTGTWENHHLTASALARAGFAVVAPRHLSDRVGGEIGEARAAEIRIGDLASALAAAKEHPHFAYADDSDISVIGYSLGGLTALAAAGGRPQVKTWKIHCRENGARDPACQDSYLAAGLRLVRNSLKWLREKIGRPPRPSRPPEIREEIRFPPPLPARAVILIAPVGAAFGDDSTAAVDAPVFIHRFGGDRVLAHPFHAERLRDLLGARASYQVHDRVHHYAFIAPLASNIKKDFPAAQDPPGFDRAAFIRALNRQIIAALTTAGGE